MLLLRFAVLALLALAPTPSFAQSYPGTTPAPQRNALQVVAERATTTSLQAMTIAGMVAGDRVLKTGYYAAGDMPAAVYTLSTSACPLNAGAGDGGSQIPSNTAGNCWVLASGTTADVRIWGAKLDSTTDDTAAIQAAITYADAISNSVSNWPIVTCGGYGRALISATLTFANTSGIHFTGCSLLANASVNWTANYPMGMVYAGEFQNNVSNFSMDHVYFDGNAVADGATLQGHNKLFNIHDNYWVRNKLYGVQAVGLYFHDNQLQQWTGNDPQHLDWPNSYTASLLWLHGVGADANHATGDGIYSNIVMNQSGINLEIGDSSGGTSGSNLFVNIHPWQGSPTAAGVITGAGTGYGDGTYTAVPFTGGSGSGKQATIVVSGGSITSVTITANGSGYAIGDVLSASNSNLGGTGSGFAFTLNMPAIPSDSVDIYIHAGSSGFFLNTYLDNGVVINENGSAWFSGVKLANSKASSIESAWFQNIAQAPGDTNQMLIMPPISNTSSTNIPLTAYCTAYHLHAPCDNSNVTNSWNIPPKMNGLSANFQSTIGTGTNVFTLSSASATNALSGYTNSSKSCLALGANWTTSGVTNKDTLLCQDGANNAKITADNLALIPSGGSSAITCSGCGTSPTILGGNASGRVQLGTSPSTTLALTFSPTWQNTPDCLVQEMSNSSGTASDVASVGATTATLTIGLSTGGANRVIHWLCNAYQ